MRACVRSRLLEDHTPSISRHGTQQEYYDHVICVWVCVTARPPSQAKCNHGTTCLAPSHLHSRIPFVGRSRTRASSTSPLFQKLLIMVTCDSPGSIVRIGIYRPSCVNMTHSRDMHIHYKRSRGYNFAQSTNTPKSLGNSVLLHKGLIQSIYWTSTTGFDCSRVAGKRVRLGLILTLPWTPT